MKTIQKLTLALLTVVASSAGFSSALTIEVDGSDTATHAGAISVGTAHKTGAGKLILQGDNSAMSMLSIDAGNVEVDTAANAMPVAITFNNAGSIFEVDVASASVPALTMATAGELLCSLDTSLVGAPSGTGLLTVVAAGKTLTIGADLHAGNAPMHINSGTVAVTHALPSGAIELLSGSTMNVSADSSSSTAPLTVDAGALATINASGKMPTAAAAINGTLELIAAPAAEAFKGAVTVGAVATLLVDASVSVPAIDGVIGGSAPSSVADIFSNAVASVSANTNGLKFVSGATLKLGNNAVWARQITVGSFD